MQLLRNALILQPDEDASENVTTSGIILTTDKRTQFAIGTVIQVGEWRERNVDGSTDDWDFGPGDRVLYRRFQVEDFDVTVDDGLVAADEGLVLTTAQAIVGVLESE